MLDEIETAPDWILITDECVEFGQNKLFVIYGVRLSKIDFSRSLNYKDLQVFSIISGNRWPGEKIAQEIQGVRQRCGSVLFAIADGGNNIKKGLSIAGIPHVYDVTHKIAWILKRIYQNNHFFVQFTKDMAMMRKKMTLSKVSHVLPPNQRSHSRFMNLEIITEWGMKTLKYLSQNKKNHLEYLQLKWVLKYESLIYELSEVMGLTKIIMCILKTQGLSKTTAKKCLLEMGLIQTNNANIDKFKEEMKKYLTETKEMVSKFKQIPCTSDIIESAFGKYKNYISKNSMAGITNLALSLAAFTKDINSDSVKNAMESVKMSDIKSWTKLNIAETNLAKRKAFLN